MLKTKKAQITAFIIIGIILIAGVITFFLVKDKINLNLNRTPKDLISVTEQIQSCIDINLYDGSKVIGLQGGYLLTPENAVETNYSSIAYGYYLGQNTLISKSDIEKEIASYIELFLPFCFEDFIFGDYLLTFGYPNASVKINSDSISVKVSYPFAASNNETHYEINQKYSSEYKIKLADMLSSSQKIIQKVAENPSRIDFTYLNSLGYDISISNAGENVIVYSLTDYTINEVGGYTFRFANRIK